MLTYMDIGEVRDELAALGPDGFARRYGRYFLVVTDPGKVDDFAGYVNTASRQGHDFGTDRSLERVMILPILPHKGGERAVIGREEEADIRIANAKVSKQHAYFLLQGGLLSISDAGSKNGTWINGAPLGADDPVPVDVGDTLQFGSIAATVWGLDDLLAAAQT
jgi:hypothetical protein